MRLLYLIIYGSTLCNLTHSAACLPPTKVYSSQDDIHYWLPHSSQSFFRANSACQDNGMVLANVSTFEKLHQVLAVVKDLGESSFWVGIYFPLNWQSCENATCHRLLFDIRGLALSYYDLKVPVKAEEKTMCLALSSRGNLSSRDCFDSLTTICERDCSKKATCEKPHEQMNLNHGRWGAFYYWENNDGQPFAQAKETCKTLNANLVFLHQLRDSWGLNYVAKSHGGPEREAYIGLDAFTVSSPCSRWGGCPDLKWLDGTPHEQRVVHWETTTNGSTSVECFIVKHFYEGDIYKIIGVNDCHKSRAFVCVSHCMRQRCPIPRYLQKAKNKWTYFEHVAGDTVE